MELVYLWVKEYKCFRNKEFNFNPKHKFKFDYINSTLEYSQNKECVDKLLWNENNGDGIINNVTAIVGNNGTGKTTLIELISEVLDYKASGMEYKVLSIFFDGKEMKVYYNYDKSECDDPNKKEIKLKTDRQDIFKYNEDDYNQSLINNAYQNSNKNKEKISELDNTHCIYHSNLFDSTYEQSEYRKNIDDISTIRLIKNNYEYYREMDLVSSDADRNIIFFNYEFYKQIEFIYNDEKLNSTNYIDFELPKYAELEFNDISNIIDNITSFIPHKLSNKVQVNDKNAEDIIISAYNGLSILNKNMKTDEDEYNDIKYKITYKFLNLIFTNFLHTNFVVNENSDLIGELREVIYGIEKEIINKFSNKTTIKNAFNYIIKFFEYIGTVSDANIFKEQSNKYINYTKYVNEWVNSLSNDELEYYEKTNLLKINISKEKFGLKKFFCEYKKFTRNYNSLNFKWGLSSGENNFLGLFARFYNLSSIEKYSKDITKSILILMDEADLTFHPKWQQKYIKILLKFLKNVFENSYIQLIIATHSPIMLSDIPNDNVIFLYKQEAEALIKNNGEIKTFCSNIYNLYKKGFFLQESNFGILGDFAVDNIKRVNTKLTLIKSKINDVENEEENKSEESGQDGFISNKSDRMKIIKDEHKYDLEYCRKTINIIGEAFIRETLQRKYDEVIEKLENGNVFIDNRKVFENVKDNFERLSKNDQRELIKYIIKLNEN